jgi:hypothetical protein
MATKKALSQMVRTVFLTTLALSVSYFALGHWRMLPNHTWNVPGFLMLLAAEPWSSLWFGQSVVMGRILGFELRNALTVAVISFAFALNCTLVFTAVVCLWRWTRSMKSGTGEMDNAS